MKRAFAYLLLACTASPLTFGSEGNSTAWRSASAVEIRELFDLAIKHPPRTHFVAELTLTKPAATARQIAAELKLQNKVMQPSESRLNPSRRLKIENVRSNTIASEFSGTRVFRVQEWYSGNKYRLDQTELGPVNADYLKGHPTDYRDTYVNLDDPAFSPYVSFSVNHRLRDAQLNRNPKFQYAPHDLWRVLGMDKRVSVPLVVALVDRHSMRHVRAGVERDTSSLKIDPWKLQHILDGSDSNWHLQARTELLHGTSVTHFYLKAHYLDLWSPPVALSSLRATGLPRIEISYWVTHKAGRLVLVRTALTNITQQASFESWRKDFDAEGYPHVWETRSLTNGVLVKGMKVVFKTIDAKPKFTDKEVFAPIFPTNYIVSDITSGKAVILQNPHPGIKVVKQASQTRKRTIVLLVLGVAALGPLCLALLVKRNSAHQRT